MPNVWNGIRVDEVKPQSRRDDPSVQASPANVTEDKITALLREATTQFYDKPEHHARCNDIHCRTHSRLFPAQRPYCLVRDYYASSLWPGLMMCRQCADLLKLLGEDRHFGTITVRPF